MGRKYAIRSNDKFYFVTFTVVYWLDVFIREEYRSIFIDSVKYCQREKGRVVGAWCIMTSHVLKCYTWAMEYREKGNCVIIGFHSQMENNVV
ncbi:MAG: hypothetical protein HC842_03585 [Cytophagales bacterium]|nr:hypothetical protein [Cytophagales bacterium]